MKLNKKHMHEISQMLGSAYNWQMIFWMQDDQDLEPGFRRREYQRRARWKKAREYYAKIVKQLEAKP